MDPNKCFEDEPEYSGASGFEEENGDEETYALKLKRELYLKCECAVNDTVWAMVNERWWPALVYRVADRKVVLYLIFYPNKEENGMTTVRMNVSFDALHKKIHNFWDREWNENTVALALASELPEKDHFLKAQCYANSYMTKRMVYNKRLYADEYFNIDKSVIEFVEGEDQFLCECLDEDCPGCSMPIR